MKDQLREYEIRRTASGFEVWLWAGTWTQIGTYTTLTLAAAAIVDSIVYSVAAPSGEEWDFYLARFRELLPLLQDNLLIRG